MTIKLGFIHAKAPAILPTLSANVNKVGEKKQIISQYYYENSFELTNLLKRGSPEVHEVYFENCFTELTSCRTKMPVKHWLSQKELNKFHSYSTYDPSKTECWEKLRGILPYSVRLLIPKQTLKNTKSRRIFSYRFDYEIFGKRNLIQTSCWTLAEQWLVRTHCQKAPLWWGGHMSSYKGILEAFAPKAP